MAQQCRAEHPVYTFLKRISTYLIYLFTILPIQLSLPHRNCTNRGNFSRLTRLLQFSWVNWNHLSFYLFKGTGVSEKINPFLSNWIIGDKKKIITSDLEYFSFPLSSETDEGADILLLLELFTFCTNWNFHQYMAINLPHEKPMDYMYLYK